MVGSEESASILEVNGRSYTNQELLVYWIQERETIRRLKEHGEPKPWSDDWVFQQTYFCNVHREDDKVTRWVRENYTPEILGEYYDYAIVAARIFNNPETLDDLLYYGGLVPFNASMMTESLLEKQKNKEKIWSGAYLITSHGRKMSKIDYCVELLGNVHNKLSVTKPKGPLCVDMHKFLKEIDGLGDFLAAQVVADLKNTEGHDLQDAEDWWTFCAPGPGSLRGLSWFFNTKVTPSTFRTYMHSAMNYVETNLQDDEVLTRLCMQDLQNCFCEYDKYMRVRTGTGRSKRKYAGLD